MFAAAASVLVAGSLLAAAPLALAGTASTSGNVISYRATAGEANDVTLTATDLSDMLVVEIRDTGAPVTAGPGCVAVDPNAASCTVPLAGAEVVVGGRDLDDTLSAEPFCPDCDAFGALPLVILGGGGGADTLLGGRAGMRLSGGADDDLLQGGPFADVLVGGPGPDRIDGGGHPIDRDVFVGDVVSYASASQGVSVDFDGAADDGAAGEGDTVVNVEGAVGGRGDDTLVGNALDNRFTGGPGADELVTGRGNDHLSGGGGADILRGGRGVDRLEGERGDDRIVGGWGDDQIAGGDMNGIGLGSRPEGRVPDRHGADTIDSGRGNDVVFAHGGRDRVFGGRGNDLIFGHRGNDRLAGGKAGDLLDACDGRADRVLGGPGLDIAAIDFGIDETKRIRDFVDCADGGGF